MKFFRLGLVVMLILSSTQSVQAANGFGPGDITTAAVWALDRCQSASELDCIESIALIDETGKETFAEFLGHSVLNTYRDPYGNQVSDGSTLWNVDGVGFSVQTQLESPEHIIFSEGGVVKLRGAALRIDVTIPEPLKKHLKIKVRTSWLKPMSIQLKTFESDFEVQNIPGGKLWTLGGFGLRYSDYDGNWGADPQKNSFQAKADVERTFFTFYIHHADSRTGYGYWPAICADQGFTVQSNNTNTTGEPSWDAASSSLQFGIYAPHLSSDGSLNKGYFRLWTTDAFLNCKFPKNNLTSSPNLKVEIIDENGKQEVAITTVSHKDGNIFVTASGFHFSAPKIVITPEKVATATPTPSASALPTPSKSPIAKNVTITCVKGKTVKKVTSIAPKCPGGYKKK